MTKVNDTVMGGKKMEKKYREYLYADFADTLQSALVTGKLGKERKVINKYFKKNYLPYFPADKNAKILDLGCGLGNYLLAAQKFGYKNVQGVDGSPQIVEFCQKNGLNCIHADAISFLKDNQKKYDVILFNDVIEHLTRDEIFEVLFLIKDTLTGGGCVLIKTLNMANPITGLAGRYIDLTHEIGFTESSMMHLLKSVSFKRVKIIGSDIYVHPVPFIYLVKLCAKINNFIWYMFNCLYGRTYIKIFDKNIIAIAYRE